MPVTSPDTKGASRWLVPVLVGVVALTVGAGLLAREWYREQAPAGDARDAITSGPATPSQERGSTGSRVVRLSADAAAHPAAGPIRRLLQRHFDAINHRDYDRWTTTVIPERAARQPRAEWLDAYRSTRDGNIVVYRIERAPDEGTTVLLGLTSTQNLEDAPADFQRRCIRWRLALPLTERYGEWRIAIPPPGTVPERSPC